MKTELMIDGRRVDLFDDMTVEHEHHYSAIKYRDVSIAMFDVGFEVADRYVGPFGVQWDDGSVTHVPDLGIARRIIDSRLGSLAGLPETGLLRRAIEVDDLELAFALLAPVLGIYYRDTLDGIFSDNDRREWRDAGVSNHRVNELSRWFAAELEYAAPAHSTYGMHNQRPAAV